MSAHRLPPLNAVRAFDAAARLGSYVEASKALHVTQPAIGRHVKLLEDWLGIQLFERTSRGVNLTPAGEKYHRKIAAALQLIMEAGKEAQPKEAERWLRIMVVPGFAKRWLMPRIERMRQLRPGLKFAIEPNSTFTEVDKKTTDLGIVYGMENEYANCRATLVCPRVFPICTPAYLASVGPLSAPVDLVKHNLIHVDNGEWWNLWFTAHGLEFHLDSDILYVNNDHALSVAESGQGIALANEVLVRNELDAGRLVKAVNTEVRLESYRVLTPSGELSEDANWFIDWLQTELNNEFGS
ncbi:LysR substrate-binding domain-containing protein [Pseudomonas juntendi]|jgi:LysR family glycine cleavage system transcriptional activator|uniref:LysR substrate-binding domain-containing protein n=2 Tax=Gammaproteobacteria TaxID=1236 RepID=A0ABD4Y9T0_9PSED|nr:MULTISPECIES: LysR substrate-binding domain-containing protein [Pseudomonas]EGB98020.1 LysR family transcriptional regulator [Pseudomonas sp. TJI-51]MBA6122120.1 LysR family transcriptional regulator [Pseudomonas juntendi]MBI6914037.1 LysR family transcriptional regulator [Pseudomonas juntendi]MBS6039550.1 LysR family transcriptional regulator [Pseudomonas sp.]MCF3158063.1 LysR substrate-binding domain-containing protein [Pseudomonas juntendi]